MVEYGEHKYTMRRAPFASSSSGGSALEASTTTRPCVAMNALATEGETLTAARCSACVRVRHDVYTISILQHHLHKPSDNTPPLTRITDADDSPTRFLLAVSISESDDTASYAITGCEERCGGHR
jgi:hypothetical protein